MIIPDYWAEAKRMNRKGGRQITIRRFGWSTRSQEEAQRMAEDRVAEAFAQCLSGEKVARREPKVAYNGADGVPIREEVIARSGEDVITRNTYGSRCLNTPNVLFADVDMTRQRQPVSCGLGLIVMGVVSIVAGYTFGKSWMIWAGLGISPILAFPLARGLNRLVEWLFGGSHVILRRKLIRFLDSRPDWNVRVYATPNGYRYLVTHQRFEPNDQDVAAFFRAVGADPVYVKMCVNQQCFRARLSAKPWRMGMVEHLRPNYWPIPEQGVSKRKRWVETYEEMAMQFASCRFERSIGSGRVHADVRTTIELHDRESRALEASFPIA